MNNSIEYSVYRQEVIYFLQSITIKFDPFVRFFKDKIYSEHGIVIESDEDNPYYKHMCGLYTDFDEPMYVTSVETELPVLFDLNLKTNYPKTYAVYRIPTIEYNNLLNKYPKQATLIKSILHPVKDLDTAIEANNLTLLAYDETLLEPTEVNNIIETIDQFLDYYRTRWYVADFYYENLYPPAIFSTLFQQLTSLIYLQRIRNLKTPFVHSTHVWEYLLSKGLGDYRDVLSTNQSLFLYRNIDYLYQNKGKTSNLEILAKNLINPLYVSLVGKTLFQETAEQSNDAILVPQVISENVEKRHENTGKEKDFNTYESIDMMVRRMYAANLEIDNSIRHILETESLLGTSMMNYLPSKLLEFKKHILDTRFLNLLLKFLTETLWYKCSKERFGYELIFTPENTTIKLKLQVSECVALLHYAACRRLNLTPDNIPTEAQCYLPYVENQPTIPKYFKWMREPGKYLTDNIIDIDTMLSNIDFSTSNFTTEIEFHDHLIQNFYQLITDVISVGASADLLFHDCMEFTYHQFLMVRRMMPVNLVPGFTMYEAWFDSNEALNSVINIYNDDATSYMRYEELHWQLLNVLLPLMDDRLKQFFSSSKDDTDYYYKLTKIFKDMGSYNVNYLETTRDSLEYIFDDPICIGHVGSKISVEDGIDLDTDFDICTTPVEHVCQRLDIFPDIDISVTPHENTCQQICTAIQAHFTDELLEFGEYSPTSKEFLFEIMSPVNSVAFVETDVTKPLNDGNFIHLVELQKYL